MLVYVTKIVAIDEKALLLIIMNSWYFYLFGVYDQLGIIIGNGKSLNKENLFNYILLHKYKIIF